GASLEMLFKTQSAAVYGIDAYLVEVEVDVGSAYMKDFNVVGLPDNAVKESRERIKAALRNCGYEFPYGQGVTINLAPADVAGVVHANQSGCEADAFRSRTVFRGLARRARPASGEARAGSGLRGRAQHFVYWPAGRRKNHASEAHPDDSAADVA